MSRVFVTGFGVISAIGNNVIQTTENLKNNCTGLGKSNYLDSKLAEQFPFGEVKLSNLDLKNILKIDDSKEYSRIDLLSIKAFEEALAHSNLTQNQLQSLNTAFITSTTIEGMCDSDKLYKVGNLISKDIEQNHSNGEGLHALRMVERYKINGITDSINTACSSSANSIMFGCRLIKSKRADIAIVGGVDSLSKFTVNGFNSLNILSNELCKPFDNSRKGINLGEAAAYLVLESEESSKGKVKYAEVVGYGNSNDAFHPSSLSENGEGVMKSMNDALHSAGIYANQIDYINAHGTATENNDKVEYYSMSKIFDKIPPFNSTKSYTGHTLAAAGSLEAIIGIISMKEKEIYKSLNFNYADDLLYDSPVQKNIKDIDIQYVLSNSFGFAGNCSSIILKNTNDVH